MLELPSRRKRERARRRFMHDGTSLLCDKMLSHVVPPCETVITLQNVEVLKAFVLAGAEG